MFNQINNNYDTPSLTRACAEFGMSSASDFHFKEGENQGVGSPFIYVSYIGPQANYSITYPEGRKFSDEGGKAIKGIKFIFIRNDNVKVEGQFYFSMACNSEGLT